MDQTTWKGKQVKQSRFEDLEYKKGFISEKSRVSKETFSQVFGEDTRMYSVQEQKSLTEQIFRQRFGEATPTTDAFKGMISETYSAVKHKNVGAMEKGKRAKESREKIALRKHLMQEQQAFVEERKRRTELSEKVIFAKDAEKYKGDISTEEEKEALRFWVMANDENEEKQLKNRRALLGGDHQRTAILAVLKAVEDSDTSEFLDKNDGEFASAYAEKYEKLCRYTSAEFYLKKLEEKDESHSVSSRDCSTTKLRAKLAFYKEMKAQYEDRIKLMSSPYYVLLRKADMKEYMGPDGEAKINAIEDESYREYVRHFVKTQSSPLAMGQTKATKSRFDEILKEKSKEQKSFDEQTANQALEKLQIGNVKKAELGIQTRELFDERKAESLSQDEQAVLGLYDDMTAYELQKFDPNNKAFLEKELPDLGGSLIDGMSVEELWEIEKNTLFGDVYEKGKIDGQPIALDVLDEIKSMLDELMASRREMVANVRASMFIMNLQNSGLGCDFKNSEFTKSEAAQKLKPYVNYKGYDFINELSNKPRARYMELYTRVFLKLSEKGYSISKKYEDRALKEADERIEYLRTAKEEEFNDGKEKPEHWSFPTVTVNGHVFSIFNEDQEKAFENLIGENIQMDGEAGEQLVKLMEEQQNLSKKLIYGRMVYQNEGGMKLMLSRTFEQNIPPKLESIGGEINRLLEKAGH